MSSFKIHKPLCQQECFTSCETEGARISGSGRGGKKLATDGYIGCKVGESGVTEGK